MAFSLHHMLLQTALRQPERTALRFAEADLTYAELAQRAAKIARFLVDQGVRRQDRVALYMNRGFDSMAAIFGIMQAGAAYVPFDSFAPPARLAAILRDCDVRYLITEEAKADRLGQIVAEYADLRQVIGMQPRADLPVESISWDEMYGATPAAAPDIGVIEEDLSLIFYTSGSTGTPKGVVHSHRSMLSNVEWALETFGLTPDDRVSNVTSHHFDLSWFELFATFAAGARLIMVPEQTVKFAANLAGLISRERMSVWCSVPSVLIQLAQHGALESHDLSALRSIMFAGERFPTKHLRQLMKLIPHARYCNMYGTTETHIAAYYPVPPLPDDSDDPIPIGRACSHVNLMAAKPDGQPAAVNETGELVVRGPSLMEGYWRLPERTERALVRYRFAPELEGLCYRTGDLVQLRPDGNYYIIGRADRRVKIRGNLVDLDEVEKVLLGHERVEEAAAYAPSVDEDRAHIEAAVVLKPGAQASAADLRAHVARILPTYATPERVVIVPEFPRTGSGKTSRRDLQAWVESEIGSAQASQPPDQAGQEDPIRAFIIGELVTDSDGVTLDDDVNLFETGLIDSMGAVRLLAFIEESYAVKVPMDEFIEQNFCDLKSIRGLIARLQERTDEQQ